jgi:hypothetical protein
MLLVRQRQPVYRGELIAISKQDGMGGRLTAGLLTVHVDQTPAAGETRIRLHMGPEEAERLLRTRAQILNVWRPMRGPVLDAPLGLIDVRSVEQKDLAVGRIFYRDR